MTNLSYCRILMTLLTASLALVAPSARAQSTETFETETGGATSFTDNGQVFNITTQSSGSFRIQTAYPGTGWSGTAVDNVYIDNDGFAVAGVGTGFTISSAGAVPFRVNSMWFYLADNFANVNTTGTLTVVGKRAGATQFTATRTSPFNNTNVGVANGFTLIDMTTFGGANNSLTNIDQLVFTTTTNFTYVALDAFRWSYPPPPEINVKGNGTTIVDGDATPATTDHTDFGAQSVCSGTIVRTFTIENTGGANLTIPSSLISGTHAADFAVTQAPAASIPGPAGTTTFQVTFNPSAAGTRTATVSITNNDPDEGVYDFAIQGTGVDPEVNLQGNGNSIADGDATPSATDHTDFGSQSVCSGTIVRTFTVQNTGNSSLSVATPTLTGANAADFSITATPGSPVSPAGSTTFQVTFNPSAAGTRTATVSFANSDCDESTYDFAIQGTGVDPEVNLQGNGNSIADGDATPSSTDHTDFGSQSVCSGTIVRTFTIQNAGNSSLSVATPTLSGPNAADFSITATPGSPVSPAGSTTFQVTFNPSATGTRTASVSFANSDCNESAYDFAIQGTGVDPEVNVQGNGVTIADGDLTPTLTDHTDFGPMESCSGTVVRTFTIQNAGNSSLSVGTPTLTGPNAADFSVSSPPAGSVAPAGSTTFQVTFNPSAAGVRSATLDFSCNDCDEATYNFSISGTGVDSPISISASAGPGGTISPSGAVSVGCAANQSFTITPGGCSAISGVLVDGAPVGAVPSYTFTNVVANHTIAASFVALAPPPAGGDLPATNLAACSVGAVPDRSSAGTPFTLVKNSGNPAHLDLAWGDSCGAGQTDFAVYEGVIGTWYNHAARTCSTGGQLVLNDFTPSAGNAYYLIVPLSPFAEGSYGTNSSGAEIPQGSGVCFGSRDTRSCD